MANCLKLSMMMIRMSYDDGQNVKNEKIVEMLFVAEKEKAVSWKDLLIGQFLLITKCRREKLLGLSLIHI